MDDYGGLIFRINELDKRISEMMAVISKQDKIINDLRGEITEIKKYSWGLREDPPIINELC